MVYAFVIHTLQQGACQVLYSRVYDGEGAPDELSPEEGAVPTSDGNRVPVTDFRKKRKDYVTSVAERVHSEYLFKSTLSGRSYENDFQNLNNEGKLPDLEIGFLRLPGGQAGIADKVAVWMGAMNCGFILVCGKIENRLLAESTLKLLVKFLQEHCRVFVQLNDILLKPDRISLVLDQFLPAGCLLFMNHRVVRQFEKELEMKMKTLTVWSCWIAYLIIPIVQQIMKHTSYSITVIGSINRLILW